MAASGKPGVMIYFETARAVKGLDYETKGRLFETIMEYAEFGVVPEFDGVLSAIWPFVSVNIDRDNDKYEAIKAARVEAGRKGGKARAENLKQSQANEANATFDKQIKPTSTSTPTPTTASASTTASNEGLRDFAIDDEIFQEQCAKILRCKVAQLQANQRTAVEMKYWENATDQAIADKLQCSRTYANTSVKDGLKALRRHDTDNTLRNLLDDLYYEKRNLYNHTGWGFLKSTGYSSPEYEVCKKEERNQRKKSRKERENEIALVMKYFEVDRATAEELLSMKTA